jgi:hypothetical protein
MQMFRPSLQRAVQGDRVGLCVTQLDARTTERGLAGAGEPFLFAACGCWPLRSKPLFLLLPLSFRSGRTFSLAFRLPRLYLNALAGASEVDNLESRNSICDRLVQRCAPSPSTRVQYLLSHSERSDGDMGSRIV